MDDIPSAFWIRSRRWLWSALKWGLFAVVMACVARQGWKLWQTTPRDALQIDWIWLVPAVAASLAGWLPSVWFWRAMLGGFGPQPRWLAVLRAYYVGHLGKYVPGKAMVLVIRAALLRDAGCAPGVSVVTAMYETLATMGAGAAIAIALSPFATSPMLWSTLPTWLQPLREQMLLMPLLVLVTTLLSLPLIARLFTAIAARMTPLPYTPPSPVPSPPSAGEKVRVRGRVPHSAPLTLTLSPHRNVGRGDKTGPDCADMCDGPITLLRRRIGIKSKTLLAGFAAVSAGWCLFAFSLGCVLRSLGVMTEFVIGFPVWLAATTLSTVGGFVILIAPGGLGVRELLMTEVLQSQPGISEAQAFLAAWLLRAVALSGELLAAGVLWWRPAWSIGIAKPQASNVDRLRLRDSAG